MRPLWCKNWDIVFNTGQELNTRIHYTFIFTCNEQPPSSDFILWTSRIAPSHSVPQNEDFGIFSTSLQALYHSCEPVKTATVAPCTYFIISGNFQLFIHHISVISRAKPFFYTASYGGKVKRRILRTLLNEKSYHLYSIATTPLKDLLANWDVWGIIINALPWSLYIFFQFYS